MAQSKKIGTHNGKFHTDEVCAIALLLRVYPDAEIVRLDRKDWAGMNACDILVDMGGVHDPSTGRFDHHQTGGAGEWSDGTKLSSCGLVWRQYDVLICPNIESADVIERALIIPVDARDNGQQPERRSRDIPSIADYVDSLNLAWNEDGDEDAVFMEAVAFVSRYLDRLIVRATAQKDADKYLDDAIRNATDPFLIILEHGLPWNEKVITNAPEAQFVILPGDPGEWMIQAIPMKLGTQQPLRRRFPESWGGKRDADLEAVTGVKGVKFATNTGHLVGTYTYDAVLEVAKKLLNYI